MAGFEVRGEACLGGHHPPSGRPPALYDALLNRLQEQAYESGLLFMKPAGFGAMAIAGLGPMG